MGNEGRSLLNVMFRCGRICAVALEFGPAYLERSRAQISERGHREKTMGVMTSEGDLEKEQEMSLRHYSEDPSTLGRDSDLRACLARRSSLFLFGETYPIEQLVVTPEHGRL